MHMIFLCISLVLTVITAQSPASTAIFCVHANWCHGTYQWDGFTYYNDKPQYEMDPSYSDTDTRVIRWNSAYDRWDCYKPSNQITFAYSSVADNFWDLNDYNDIEDQQSEDGITVRDCTDYVEEIWCVTAYASTGNYTFTGTYSGSWPFQPIFEMDPPFSDLDEREIYYNGASSRWEIKKVSTDALFAWSLSGEYSFEELADYNDVIGDPDETRGITVVDCTPPKAAAVSFPGFELLSKGYNVFQDDLSGSPILDLNMIGDNIKSETTLGTECSYSSVEFSASYSSYNAYATADTNSIEAGFSTGDAAGGGSASVMREEMRQEAQSSLSEIYTMNLKCSVREVTINGLNNLYFDSDFMNHLKTLPDSYIDGDDFDDYEDFWNQYGTHVMITAEFGGSIHGALVTDACSVENTYGSSTAYEGCLNAAYKGVDVGGCHGEADSSLTSESIQNSVTKTKIVVKGGYRSQFTEIFNTFSNKETDFQGWIDDLENTPHVIGGNVNEIHDVIQKVLDLGNHSLHSSLSDEQWLAKADALEAAYIAYGTNQQTEDTTFTEDECHVECTRGVVSVEKCICEDCGSSCCQTDDAVVPKANLFYLFMLFLCIFVK